MHRVLLLSLADDAKSIEVSHLVIELTELNRLIHSLSFARSNINLVSVLIQILGLLQYPRTALYVHMLGLFLFVQDS